MTTQLQLINIIFIYIHIYIYIYIHKNFLPIICFSSVSSSYINSLCFILVSLLAFLTQRSTYYSYPNNEASLGFRRFEQGLHDLSTKDTDVDWNLCMLVCVCLYNDRDKSHLVYIPKTNRFFFTSLQYHVFEMRSVTDRSTDTVNLIYALLT